MVSSLLILASSVCKSLQYLILALTQRKKSHLFRLTFSAVLWEKKEGQCKQISLACMGSGHSGWTTLGLPQPKATCASWIHTTQAPGCSAKALFQVGPAFCIFPRSKPLRFSGVPRSQTQLGFVPFSQVQATQAAGCLASTPSQVGGASYAPAWSLHLVS